MTKGDEFIKKVSKQSLDGKILWNRMFEYEKLCPESNKKLYNIIIQSEFSQIDFATSYYAIIKNAAVFIINETSISGRDGTMTSGYVVYIQDEDNDNKIYSVPCGQSSIYQLINSIESYLTTKEKEVNLFIDRYLQDSDQ